MRQEGNYSFTPEEGGSERYFHLCISYLGHTRSPQFLIYRIRIKLHVVTVSSNSNVLLIYYFLFFLIKVGTRIKLVTFNTFRDSCTS
jgi:hypothetical protein